MGKHGLRNAAIEERLRRLDAQIRSDKVMVAFVAEFSRGKSELINPIFFVEYGRRILPAGAGRTTMCPTELGYDPDIASCLRLLPIETRLEPQSLVEWRLIPEKWHQIDLDLGDAAHLAASLHKVTEVQHVSVERARALEFWNDNSLKENPPVSPDGLVEIPKWRHALINIAHPLLAQGLVIFDTPVLNAIGADPELTASLIPQSHAVVLILSADTGVTESDLAIWHDYLGGGQKNGIDAASGQTRLVVLNKIDSLWGLNTAAQIQAQIDQQIAESANLPGLQQSEVIAVSAQKGLVAKITKNHAFLQASQLLALEQLLGQCIMEQRQKILRAAVIACIGQLKSEAGRILSMRRRDLAGQILELHALSGKNRGVVSQMRSRIAQDQAGFASGSARIHAVRSVNGGLFAQAVGLLGMTALKAELAELLEVLGQPGIKLRLKKIYGQTFVQLRERLYRGQALATEIQAMLDSAFRQINTEFGFSLQAVRALDLTRHVQSIDTIEASHMQHLGLGNIVRLAQTNFSDRLVRTLSGRLRAVFDSALDELELWNKSALVQLDTQLRERHQNVARRLEAVERIQLATSTLDERIADLDGQQRIQKGIETKFAGLTSRLLELQPVQSAAKQSGDVPVIFAAAEQSA